MENDAPTEEDYQALLDLNMRLSIRTAIPGIVTGLQKLKSRLAVTVQLSPKQMLRDGRVEDIVTVERVPIGYQTGGGITIRHKLDIGDGVLCHVSDRTLEGYLSGGGRTYRPIFGDTHNPNDIIAVPMLSPDANEPTVSLNPQELYIGDYDGSKTFMRMNVAKGTVTLETTSTIDIKCAGPANIDSPLVTIGSTGVPAPIARVGTDFVLVPPGVGHPGGTFPILSGPIPGGPASSHTVKG